MGTNSTTFLHPPPLSKFGFSSIEKKWLGATKRKEFAAIGTMSAPPPKKKIFSLKMAGWMTCDFTVQPLYNSHPWDSINVAIVGR